MRFASATASDDARTSLQRSNLNIEEWKLVLKIIEKVRFTKAALPTGGLGAVAVSPPAPAVDPDLIFKRSRSACLPTAAVFEVTEVAELNLLDNAPLSRAPLPTGPCEAGTEVAVD